MYSFYAYNSPYKEYELIQLEKIQNLDNDCHKKYYIVWYLVTLAMMNGESTLDMHDSSMIFKLLDWHIDDDSKEARELQKCFDQIALDNIKDYDLSNHFLTVYGDFIIPNAILSEDGFHYKKIMHKFKKIKHWYFLYHPEIDNDCLIS